MQNRENPDHFRGETIGIINVVGNTEKVGGRDPSGGSALFGKWGGGRGAEIGFQRDFLFRHPDDRLLHDLRRAEALINQAEPTHRFVAFP
jgi:hypothetical protein